MVTMDYYVYSNYALKMICSNEYPGSVNYLNVSTLATDDSTWAVNEIYSATDRNLHLIVNITNGKSGYCLYYVKCFNL
jgi:hypothetical protein